MKYPAVLPHVLNSAVAQPRMTFGGQELYSSVAEKAALLGFSLIKNHPFLGVIKGLVIQQ